MQKPRNLCFYSDLQTGNFITKNVQTDAILTVGTNVDNVGSVLGLAATYLCTSKICTYVGRYVCLCKYNL